MKRLRLVLSLCLALAAVGGAARAQTPVDLALVLAVDASSSVNATEFNLQMGGIADAFRDSEVQGAIAGVGELGVAVAMVQWASQHRQVLAVDWMLVFDPASAEEFASLVEATPRFVNGGSTALGSALSFATQVMNTGPYAGTRRVIDVSGDGRANQGIAAFRGRDEAIDAGITVNGLAILNEEPGLDIYYRDQVIGGSGAFVLSAVDYEDFARAMRLKLVREMSGPPIAWPLPKHAGPLQTARRESEK